jgi:hypothetical protein
MKNNMTMFQVEGSSLEEMKENARNNPLYSKGDMILMWVNEGDYYDKLFTSKESKFSVGDKFYYVKEENLALTRKKISREIDGEIWYKYDKPPKSYYLVECEILGLISKQLNGKWNENEESSLIDEIYVRFSREKESKVWFETTFIDFFDDYKIFSNKDDAMEYKLQLEKKLKEQE